MAGVPHGSISWLLLINSAKLFLSMDLFYCVIRVIDLDYRNINFFSGYAQTLIQMVFMLYYYINRQDVIVL